MMSKKTPSLERQGYHHGNLKEALVAAARKLIAERGPAGFTLAEAARLAGVSAAAPYRHFKDRGALIAEVAQRGFKEFGARLAAAWGRSQDEPIAAFERMGVAYLAFAREEPGFYGAMFARGGDAEGQSGAAGAAAFLALENAAGAFAKSAKGSASHEANRSLTYQVWALSHGIAMLAAVRLLPQDDPSLSPERLLRAGVHALIVANRAPKAEKAQRRTTPSGGSAP